MTTPPTGSGVRPRSERNSVLRSPIRADRVRNPGEGAGFAFIPNRFLRDGFFASMPSTEQRLYFLLILAADRRGQSFYHYDSICSLLEITVDEYIDARNGLLERDLIAFDGSRFQVLSLPEAPKVIEARPPRGEPDTGTSAIRSPEIREQIVAALRR